MSKYEVSYRENGILKGKGFKSREQFDRFIAQLNKKFNVEIVMMIVDFQKVEG